MVSSMYSWINQVEEWLTSCERHSGLVYIFVMLFTMSYKLKLVTFYFWSMCVILQVEKNETTVELVGYCTGKLEKFDRQAMTWKKIHLNMKYFEYIILFHKHILKIFSMKVFTTDIIHSAFELSITKYLLFQVLSYSYTILSWPLRKRTSLMLRNFMIHIRKYFTLMWILLGIKILHYK